MKYTILIYERRSDFSARTDGTRKDAYWGAYRAYTKALARAIGLSEDAAVRDFLVRRSSAL